MEYNSIWDTNHKKPILSDTIHFCTLQYDGATLLFAVNKVLS